MRARYQLQVEDGKRKLSFFIAWSQLCLKARKGEENVPLSSHRESPKMTQAFVALWWKMLSGTVKITW